MAQQPDQSHLKTTGKAGSHLCAFATQGPLKGQRFVKPVNGLWIPAGFASAEEMKSAGLSAAFGDIFDNIWASKGGAA